MNCEQSVDKCGDEKFVSMMIKYCPATCGVCGAHKCQDQINSCSEMKSLCNNDELCRTFGWINYREV